MNIIINGSNSLENLALQLCRELKGRQNNVFQSQYIITQTEGMNNWLKIKMAEHLGIAANCRFLKPNDLINEIYYKLGSPNKLALSSSTLQWVLFTLLATTEFRNRFTKIAGYYVNDDVKRMALASKTADLFDQYQIYRPDMVRTWNAIDGEYSIPNGWQKYLWVKAKEVLGSGMPDKTEIGRHIIESLKDPDQQNKLSGLVPVIHVFGLSIITAYHVQLFYELSKVISISIHLLNPAPSIYWQEDKSEKQVAAWRQKSAVSLGDLQGTGNPLLTNWGRVLQDTFGLFFESDDLIDRYNEVDPVEPGTDSLLGKIQNDIFNNSDAEDRNAVSAGDLDDESITINSCYTIAREVEVLYNYLVHLAARETEGLAPRDIVVMVSDIDAYAPYIKAVFNAAPYKFPFAVADESFAITDNLFSALQSILSLTEETFKAEEVLQLLESNLIRKRFRISDIHSIRKAVDAANIRFGINGRQEDDTVYVSWKNGINRIMYGLCMGGEEEYALNGLPLYPLDIAEGVEGLELIRFCHFAEVLISTIEERKQLRTITEWGEYIEQVADKLICQAEDNNDDDYQLLLRNLEGLYALDGLVKDRISFEVFKHSFVNPLSAEARSSVFASGGITFCSLIPMRSIPFRVVALLGLNFDKFPRRETRSSFDIMEQEKRRRGDRNVKENDKHLFLETILSAQKNLYISYLGHSSKDNTPKPASVLVDELIEYIQAGIADQHCNVREKLITTHPLHGFSQKYQQNVPGFYNYLNTQEPATVPDEHSREQEEAALNFEEVSTDAFIRFFKNPFKAYYNKTLGIRYGRDEVLLPEDEIFEMDNLQNWQLKQDLLFIQPEDMASYRKKGIATGILPLKHMADHVLSSTETGLVSVKDLLKDCIGEAVEESANIDLNVDGTQLKGRISHIYGDKLIVISFSKKECKYMLEGCLQYLLSTAMKHPVELNFISANKMNVYRIGKNAFSAKTALNTLSNLMKLYKQGHEKILMFHPDFDISPSAIASITENDFDKMIQKLLDFEFKDIYMEKAYTYGFFDEAGICEQYMHASRQIFGEQAAFYEEYYSK